MRQLSMDYAANSDGSANQLKLKGVLIFQNSMVCYRNYIFFLSFKFELFLLISLVRKLVVVGLLMGSLNVHGL